MNHRRTNLLQIAVIPGLMLLSLSGCKYDRSFMNMDSNSGAPFFGLQLAVDSGSRAPMNSRSAADLDRPTPPFQRFPAIPEHSKSAAGSQPLVMLTRSAATKPNGFKSTSDASELKTNVRYSLQAPTTDKSLQTQTIDLRLSAF